MRIEFLLEEYSMKVFLENLLPRVLPENMKLNEHYFLRSHDGKSDLIKSIPKKIRAFNNFSTPFGIVILHDQDSNDCILLKEELQSLCNPESKNIKYLVRIVCRELESWYLGDMDAIQNAYPKFAARKYKGKAKYRYPDKTNASFELKKIVPSFQKVEGAKKISPFINIEYNKSPSFKQFLKGLKNLIEITPPSPSQQNTYKTR
jgi:hypothetical protein